MYKQSSKIQFYKILIMYNFGFVWFIFLIFILLYKCNQYLYCIDEEIGVLKLKNFDVIEFIKL